ncbi:MAG: hypothetical protein Q4D79_15095, partial [Propionibacteriaceae bacterium]|nr:hypothetical protein [Propionibacteriaceae bacterium]
MKVLQRVCTASDDSCGQYLAPAMADWIEAMEAEGALAGQDRYIPEVYAELLVISAAMIDRHLARPGEAPMRGKCATRPGSLLRTLITIRKADDEVETELDFFEVDTVARCGPTLKGEFARSVNFTCLRTGWVFTHAIRNNAHSHIRAAFDAFIDQIPFAATGIDCGNDSEFINHDLIDWTAYRKAFFTRAGPHKKNDHATIKPKNSHLVGRYGFHHPSLRHSRRASPAQPSAWCLIVKSPCGGGLCFTG